MFFNNMYCNLKSCGAGDREAAAAAVALAAGEGRGGAGEEPGVVPRQPRAAARERRRTPPRAPAHARLQRHAEGEFL